MDKRAIIYVPGLNDDAFLNKNLAKILPFIWKRYGFEMYIIRPHWKNGRNFTPKLELIINKIDELSKEGYKVYLFGQSAGGSAVLNAFAARKNKISGVVNICGRLMKGNHVFPSLEFATKGNPAFAESVILFENKNEKKLKEEDRKKVLTIKPMWDEIVPASTVALPRATNITIPMIEHSIGGIAALTIFSNKIISLLNKN